MPELTVSSLPGRSQRCAAYRVAGTPPRTPSTVDVAVLRDLKKRVRAESGETE